MSKTGKRLAQNTAIQVIGKGLATILGIATIGIFTRHLGTAGYGDFTFVLTYLSIFAVVVDFGLTLTTVQMISQKKANEKRLLGNLLSVRLLSAVIFLAIAPVIAIFFPTTALIKVAIAVGAISYLFGTTSQMMVGIFQKRLIMWQVVVAELMNRGAVFIGAIFAAMLGLDLVGVIWLLVIGNFLQLFTISRFAKRHVDLSLRFERGVIKDIFRRSWPIGASIFFNLIYLKADVLFLKFYRTSEEVGLYGAAYKVVDVMTSIPVMFMGLMLPILTLAFSKGHALNFNKTMQKTFDFFSIIAIGFVFGTFALAVPVMELIAGPEFTESGRVLMILGPAAAIVFFGALYGHAIVAVNKQKPMTLGYFAVAILTVIGYVILIPRMGMWGAAYMTLFAEALITLIAFGVIVKVTKFLPNFWTAAKAAFAGLIMYAFLVLVPMHVILAIILGSLIYLIALIALRGIHLSELKYLFLPEKPPIV